MRYGYGGWGRRKFCAVELNRHYGWRCQCHVFGEQWDPEASPYRDRSTEGNQKARER